VVLRYMHDPFTREFVNVGVLMSAPEARFIAFERLANLDRVKGMFPGADSEALRYSLNFLAARTAELCAKPSEPAGNDLVSADAIAKSILPQDDSALQWSPSGGGVTDDPRKTLDEVYDLLVGRYANAQTTQSPHKVQMH
jgi:Protein of unknown function (DUF3037)